jgi:DNA-binding transcriptional regulator YhcF (GntR family)
MDLHPDASSPIPIYYQIAEAIRYRVATGLLRPGQRLPSVRDAAQRWQAHFHTVRRAYQELARQGIVLIDGPKGVRVCARGPHTPDAIGTFVQRAMRDAARRFGLSPADLARRFLASANTLTPFKGPVYVLECSLTQCQDLAQQLRRQFDVDAIPWPLSNPDPLPAGELIATLFHVNDLRRRCPQRLAAVHFVSIHLDPNLPALLAARVKAGATVRVCDPDLEMSRNIAADLAGGFASRDRPPRIELAVQRGLPRPRHGQMHVVSPRLWGTLTDVERRRPDVVQARYVVDPRELSDLAARLGWLPARAQEDVA